jgi:hypothetical protein
MREMWRAIKALLRARSTPLDRLPNRPRPPSATSVLHVCAWCFRRWPRGVRASHGICRRHFQEALADLDRLTGV